MPASGRTGHQSADERHARNLEGLAAGEIDDGCE
jgi:hypothetical protein